MRFIGILSLTAKGRCVTTHEVSFSKGVNRLKRMGVQKDTPIFDLDGDGVELIFKTDL